MDRATIATFAGSVCSVLLAQSLLKKFSGKGLGPDALVGPGCFLPAVALGAGITVIPAKRCTMNTPIQTTNASNYGKLALALSLGGTVLAILIGLVARALGYDVGMWAYLLFAAFQIAAIVIGLRFRHESLGRASAITAGILLVLSLGLLA